jgi:hypothetical protein
MNITIGLIYIVLQVVHGFVHKRLLFNSFYIAGSQIYVKAEMAKHRSWTLRLNLFRHFC